MGAETVTIAALLGFDEYPAGRDGDRHWLLEHSDAATFALTADQLPHGGWIAQGLGYECTVEVTVPVDSAEADAAITNSCR